jgi:hypothetical protein
LRPADFGSLVHSKDRQNISLKCTDSITTHEWLAGNVHAADLIVTAAASAPPPIQERTRMRNSETKHKLRTRIIIIISSCPFEPRSCELARYRSWCFCEHLAAIRSYPADEQPDERLETHIRALVSLLSALRDGCSFDSRRPRRYKNSARRKHESAILKVPD